MNVVKYMSTDPVQLTKMLYPAIGQACRSGIVVCFVQGSCSCALDRDCPTAIKSQNHCCLLATFPCSQKVGDANATLICIKPKSYY